MARAALPVVSAVVAVVAFLLQKYHLAVFALAAAIGDGLWLVYGSSRGRRSKPGSALHAWLMPAASSPWFYTVAVGVLVFCLVLATMVSVSLDDHRSMQAAYLFIVGVPAMLLSYLVRMRGQ